MAPQHVVPAWDSETLYAANDLGDSLTPIDPKTGQRPDRHPGHGSVPNMYFTPNGDFAIVVEEARQILAFRDPHNFTLIKALPVTRAGVDDADFSVDGSIRHLQLRVFAKMVKIDLRTLSVAGYLNTARLSPQDVKLDSAGQISTPQTCTGAGYAPRPTPSGWSASSRPVPTPMACTCPGTAGTCTSPTAAPVPYPSSIWPPGRWP